MFYVLEIVHLLNCKTTLTCIKHLIMHLTYQVDPCVVSLQFFTMLFDVTVIVVDLVYYGSNFSRLW